MQRILPVKSYNGEHLESSLNTSALQKRLSCNVSIAY